QQALLSHPITVYGDGKQSRSFTHVTDVVSALIGLSEHPKAVGEVFNVGNGREITIERLALLIKKMTNSKSKIVYIPYDKAFEKGFEDMIRRVPDITKINHLIGYKPRVNLEESLEKIIDYYRE
ncbi:MAG: GDP-mannose 4,6-dehydratase, partial [candidate division Zixibacteria bacterium]|nr:GDP-mannose 4,6-dehydratase [candidate division Zixibacteria bacterium]